MKTLNNVILFLSILSISGIVYGADNVTKNENSETKKEETVTFSTEVTQAKDNATSKAENELDKFGFGPAIFLIEYDEEILKDSKDIKVRGDGTISSSGSKYSASLGVELHYDFSFGRKIKCYSNCNVASNWNVTSSHRLSPFIGLFDIENGINGMAAGFIYGYTKGDSNGENKTTLNFGVGWTVHKDRLVLSSDVKEGLIPLADLNFEDYTQRKDVEGLTFMLSVNMGF